MRTAHNPSTTDDSLIALVADGDSEARQVLATRLRKLRGMGRNSEAKLLAEKAHARFSKSVLHSDIVQDKD